MDTRTIIFDFDGTLVDSAPSIIRSLALAFDEVGITPKFALTPEIVGPPLDQILLKLVCPGEESKITDLRESFRSIYDHKECCNAVAYESIEEVIRELSSGGITLHIATNKRKIPTQRIISSLGWEGHFEYIISPDSTHSKVLTKSDILKYILRESEPDINSVLYIGDRREDALASREAGVAFAMAMWGYEFDSVNDIDSPKLYKPGDILNHLH